MCGICGLFRTDGNLGFTKKQLKDMTDTLSHRGPDEEGFFLDSFAALGHRRLSIIDLKSGQQPIFNEDNTIVVIFNGEIYNFQSVRKELQEKGHIFKTNSDTEMIIHAYEEYGVDCLSYFRGMFSFVIYDLKKKELFAARDRLGIKPFYYSYIDNTLIFASEIKAILASNKVNKDIDITALSDYLTYMYIPAPKSIFTSIKKLPAGHYLKVQNSKIDIVQYWDISFKTEPKTEEEYIQELSNILQDSIKMRMISEVPLGAFLSGGIDSSLVVANMSRILDKPVITNTIGFNESSFNENQYAQETSKHFITDHHEYTVDLDCTKILDKLAWFYDEPFADSSMLPTYYVSKMTRQNVTVALSGDGGDENFAGYRRYYYDVLENKLRGIIPNFIRKSVIAGLAYAYPKADWLPQVFRAKTLLTNISKSSAHGYYHTMSHFYPAMKQRIFNEKTNNKLKDYSPFDIFKYHYDKADTDDLLSKIQYVDIKTYLVEDILTKVDRASMANSLEVRVPILDHVFMEYAAKIPSDLKLHKGTQKYIFKKVAKEILPDNIINRKKMGFSIPIDLWFRKDLKLEVENSLFQKGSFIDEYMNIQHIKKMFKEHQLGTKNYGIQFWGLLMLDKWAKNYL